MVAKKRHLLVHELHWVLIFIITCWFSIIRWQYFLIFPRSRYCSAVDSVRRLLEGAPICPPTDESFSNSICNASACKHHRTPSKFDVDNTGRTLFSHEVPWVSQYQSTTSYIRLVFVLENGWLWEVDTDNGSHDQGSDPHYHDCDRGQRSTHWAIQ